MVKNIVLLTMICVSIVQAEFQIREINYNNEQELEKVAKLFEFEDVQKMTGGWTKQSMLYDLQFSKKLSKCAGTEKKRDNTIICIDEFENVCGILRWSRDEEIDSDLNSLYIRTIAVHTRFRNRGIASKLLSYIECHCIDDATKNLELDVYAHNSSAIKCYTKNQFYMPLTSKILHYTTISIARLQGTSSEHFIRMRKNIEHNNQRNYMSFCQHFDSN